ncbi:DUF3810 domain-containing protein [Lutimonas halocynthiae]|uniref:DUF3810 domain-containing protein n=1 Tax=Lutimonas halocynthiae TaxID=1446477 RepID=UPI0025B49676|nr:DUF3810 domain-containing protein [Lutimonas halocynthiae]MDN3644330.1 DUF3810 domain-containing protein [Lutimonas halocynthiae]
MYKEKRNILLSVFLFFQIGIVALLSNYPEFIDRFYVNGLYPVIASILRFITGWVPFSIGDIIYGVLIFLILRFLYKLIMPKGQKRKNLLLQFLAGASVFYFCFYLFWGLNYSRSPISKSFSLEEESFDIEQLELITEKILFKTSSLQKSLSGHDTLQVEINYSKHKILELTKIGYDELSQDFPQLAYNRPSIKKSLFSLPLTYMGFSGYFNPLSGEAQVDHLIPKINLPFTCSHEVAHQLGIASESEANFLGFLAGTYHKDPYFQYAAYLLVLRYALLDIRRYNKELFDTYLKRIPKGVLKNMRESDIFWKQYENPFEPLFKIFYDNYLKYNQHKDGLESYNQIMGLVISFDKSYPLNFN